MPPPSSPQPHPATAVRYAARLWARSNNRVAHQPGLSNRCIPAARSVATEEDRELEDPWFSAVVGGLHEAGYGEAAR